MKLTIEIESAGGATRARMTRGERTWERLLGPAACNCLLRVTDAIEARAYLAREPRGSVEAAWRRIVDRDGDVTIASLVAESGLSKDRSAAALRSAMQRGKLVRVGRGRYAASAGLLSCA